MTTLTYWLLTATWKGSLVIAATLLVLRLGRGRIASRWLHALLLVAVVRLLLPIAPESRFSIFNLTTRATPVPTLARAATPSPEFATPVRRQAPLPVPAAPSWPWRSALAGVWAAGCAFVVLRAAVRMRALRRRLRDATDVLSPDVLALAEDCRRIAGIRRRVRLLETGAVATPSLHGLLQPALLLPRGFVDSFSLTQLRFVLLHELAHLRRSDVLVNWLTIAAQALHWFNPLVHLAAARLAEERELACDALALERLDAEERSAYGGTVLEVLDRMRLPSPVPGLVGMTTTQRQMKRRILMIARFRPQTRFPLLAAAFVAVIALATLTDASGEERRMFRKQLAGPEAEAVMKGLDKRIDLQFQDASLLELTNAITAHTGVAIQFGPGALDAVPADAVTLTATNVPAHAILIETLEALDLGVRFENDGVFVEKLAAGGEPRMKMRLRHAMPPPRSEPLSSGARRAIEGLEKPVTIELQKAGVTELTNAVAAQTGVSIVFAPGALDGIAADAVTVSADDMPAHAVLIRTLGELGLAVRFDDDGARVEKLPEGTRMLRMRDREPLPDRVFFIDRAAPREGFEMRAPVPAPEGREEAVFFERRAIDEEPDAAGDGVARRRVTFRGGPEGQTDGKLEIAVRRNPTSTMQ